MSPILKSCVRRFVEEWSYYSNELPVPSLVAVCVDLSQSQRVCVAVRCERDRSVCARVANLRGLCADVSGCAMCVRRCA